MRIDSSMSQSCTRANARSLSHSATLTGVCVSQSQSPRPRGGGGRAASVVGEEPVQETGGAGAGRGSVGK